MVILVHPGLFQATPDSHRYMPSDFSEKAPVDESMESWDASSSFTESAEDRPGLSETVQKKSLESWKTFSSRSIPTDLLDGACNSPVKGQIETFPFVSMSDERRFPDRTKKLEVSGSKLSFDFPFYSPGVEVLIASLIADHENIGNFSSTQSGVLCDLLSQKDALVLAAYRIGDWYKDMRIFSM
uniref:Uncharacterized protein n=1 Tax=Corethron hystrix TaxID=216773 RepID=A0A7S1BKU8_9STRA|mmetsp:Transcript_30196/g.69216  ORF Transcript_30196/g.69216 Transcript_30196/m.69216 type:complete len:184 (+) Transcript_30196:1010-1561(+)